MILVQPDNPLDVKPEALQGLVEGIRELGRDATLTYHDPEEGTLGVTWWEVVTIRVVLALRLEALTTLIVYGHNK